MRSEWAEVVRGNQGRETRGDGRGQLVIAGMLVIAIAGCAHSEARCDRRPRSPEHAPPGASAAERDWYARRLKELNLVRTFYDQGVRRFSAAAESGPGGAEFRAIHNELTYGGGGEFLYEELPDGSWAYRCDDVTRLYALAAYRYAVFYADLARETPEPFRSGSARGWFCTALIARPDIVFETAKHEELSTPARRALDAARKDSFCYTEDGWRTESQPYHHNPSYGRFPR